MIARVAALLCLLALIAPGAALAQGGGAFQPLPPAPPEQPTTSAPTNADEDEDDGLSSTQQFLIAISGIVLLFGIGWLIVRDARSTAPVQDRGPAGDEQRRKGSQKPASVRHRQSRSKAKAARQARKKARKR
ncbi:MAG TPA: hypothetical protein VF529_15160 [Solirubrobacteraceae bacterium]|jgi:hypothetical protein